MSSDATTADSPDSAGAPQLDAAQENMQDGAEDVDVDHAQVRADESVSGAGPTAVEETHALVPPIEPAERAPRVADVADAPEPLATSAEQQEQQDWDEPPAYMEPSEPPSWSPSWSEQPTFVEPEYFSAGALQAGSADLSESWAPPDVSPDYAPPYEPYQPSYAPPAYAQSADVMDGYQPPARYPARYAPPVYPLPPTRRSRLPLLLVTLAAAIGVTLVVVAVATNAFRAGSRPTTGTLYSSAMTAQSGDWPNDKECYFKSDGYHIVGASNCYYSGGAYQDATITVTAKQVKGGSEGGYGIAFRRPSPNKFYAFLITSGGDWFVLNGDAILQKPAHGAAIKTGVGASNALSVRMQGAHFTFFANGAQLGELSDESYSGGAVGLAGDVSLDVVYRNFSVTRP